MPSRINALASRVTGLLGEARRRLEMAPVARLVWLGIGIYGVGFVVLVALGLSGTSSGILHPLLFQGGDSRLIAGGPKAIRSDEWLVSTPLLLAQIEQGFPRFSDIVPGGMDVSVLWDVPYREWSVLLRPHLWGFFFLPLDHAFAFKWWLPAAVLGASTYALLVTLWRRPVAALVVSAALLFSPFLQWWYLPITHWSLAFGVVTATCVVWMLRTPRARTRWLLAALTAYLATVAVVSLYPAFLVPCALVTLAFALGWIFQPGSPLTLRTRLGRLIPLGAAACAAAALSAAYVLTRLDTIRAILSTSYPGERLWASGQAGGLSWESGLAGVFGLALGRADLSSFAPNPSEGSSFIFVGYYLLPLAVFLIVDRWRTTRRIDWVLVAPLIVSLVLVAFICVPGWDPLAHLLLLDRTIPTRLLIGFGLASLFLAALVVHRTVQLTSRPPLWTGLLCAVLVVGTHLVVAAHLRDAAPPVLAAVPRWALLTACLTVSIFLLTRVRLATAAVLLLAVSLVVAGRTNPVYRGVLDVRASELGHEVAKLNDAQPGTWVGIGGYGVTAVLRETAVESFSGVQAWPSPEMWHALDPAGSNEFVWNRYAHVGWTADPAAPAISQPAPDAIVLRLDSCEPFAQQNLDYVVSDTPIDQGCLQLRDEVTADAASYWIYTLVPASS